MDLDASIIVILTASISFVRMFKNEKTIKIYGKKNVDKGGA